MASQSLSDTNTTGATLAVNTKGEALVTYVRSSGTPRHVLAWGALNALASTSGQPQVRFKFDYTGGWGKYRKPGYWKTFKNACRPYDGPALADFVAGCDAPDGSYWALQSWQRIMPGLGFQPFAPNQGRYELHLSHWTGPLPQLSVAVHYTYGHSAVGLFGQLTYQGQPVYGFADDAGRQPEGALLAQRLHRHAELHLRRRLAPRDRDPAPPSRRDVLPQLRPPDPATRLSEPGRRARRARRRLPRHGDGAGSDSGRLVAGRWAPPVDGKRLAAGDPGERRGALGGRDERR